MSEVTPVSEVIENLKHSRFARASKVSGRKLFANTIPPIKGGTKTIPRCVIGSVTAGKQVMPCSAFAGHEPWYARVHGFARPHYSRLSEMGSFIY